MEKAASNQAAVAKSTLQNGDFTNMRKLLDFARRLRRGPLLVLLLAFGLAALLVATRPERPTVQLPERAWNVEVIVAEPRSLSPTLELNARLESPEDASLQAALAGDVLEVLVRDGDRVETGELLARLDDRDLRLELVQREADVAEITAQLQLERRRLVRNREALARERELLELAEKNAARARELYKDKLVSLANLDDSAEELKRAQLAVTSRLLAIEESELRSQQHQAQLARAEALRDKAALDVERSRITAPFGGLIADVDISVGGRVRAGDTLMRLYNPQRLELRTQLPTRYAALLREALSRNDESLHASVRVGSEELPAKLMRISGQTRAGSGSVDAFLKFIEAPASVQLGATLRLLLSLPAQDDSLAVPAEALYGRDRVFVVEGQRMVSRPVERLGERQTSDGRSEVIIRAPTITAGDLIISSRLSAAADGMLVKLPPGYGLEPDEAETRLVKTNEGV